MKPVVVNNIAQREIDTAAAFYESRRDGFGAKFIERVVEALERIEIAPEGYQPVFKDLRRVNLRQFRDYALWFQVRPDMSIVVACLSSRKHPIHVKERALGVIPFPKP